MKREDIQFICTHQVHSFFGEDFFYELHCWDLPKQGGWWCVLNRNGRHYLTMERYEFVQAALADAQELVYRIYLKDGKL